MMAVTPLWQPQAFFAKVRSGLLGPTLSQGEVDGCNAILAACADWPEAWTAYALATAYLETWHTMQPIKEVGSDAYFDRMYGPGGLRPAVAHGLGNTEPGDGHVFPGRGYVELTGRANYERADRKLGLAGKLVKEPDLALRSDIAAQIMRHGMAEGWFTGRKLSDFLPSTGSATRAQFIAARRVINGQDRATDIADFALSFAEALMAAAGVA